jgi:hypothetical protein
VNTPQGLHLEEELGQLLQSAGIHTKGWPRQAVRSPRFVCMEIHPGFGCGRIHVDGRSSSPCSQYRHMTPCMQTAVCIASKGHQSGSPGSARGTSTNGVAGTRTIGRVMDRRATRGMSTALFQLYLYNLNKRCSMSGWQTVWHSKSNSREFA